MTRLRCTGLGTVSGVTTSAAESLWLTTAPATSYAPLAGDLEVDVAVLGGGITGLTAALLLKRDGARVAVLEALRVGSGVTGCTTAKVSALQMTVLQQIRRRHGTDGAAVYAEANVAGVELVARLAREEGIDCDLERRPAFTYAATEDERSSVEDEHEAAAEAGLPVTLVDDVDLPYPTFGAVRLDDQLQLHPVKFVQGLAAAVDGDPEQPVLRAEVVRHERDVDARAEATSRLDEVVALRRDASAGSVETASHVVVVPGLRPRLISATVEIYATGLYGQFNTR